MHIYLVTNLVNGKMYVGQTIKTVEERWKVHLKEAKRGRVGHLYQAIRKYGAGAFVAEGVTGCDSQGQLNELEKMWIILLGTKDKRWGYNMTFGGDGCSGYTFSEESRKKISRAMQGHPCSQSQRDAISRIHRGKVTPLSVRQKMAACWDSARREKQAEVARRVNAVENKRLGDYACPTCGREFRQVTKGVYGGHRKACLFWNSSGAVEGPQPA